MQTPQDASYTKDDMLNHKKMAEKYNLDPEQTYALMSRLYRRNMHVNVMSIARDKNNRPIQVRKSIPVVMPLRTAHTSKNDPTRKKPYLVHPMAHDYFLAEYAKLYQNETQNESIADKINTGKKRLIDNANTATITQAIATEKAKGK